MTGIRRSHDEPRLDLPTWQLLSGLGRYRHPKEFLLGQEAQEWWLQGYRPEAVRQEVSQESD